MITIKRNLSATVKVNLNPSKFDSGQDVDIVFFSDSRPTITLTKSLTTLRSGFYSFDVSAVESEDFIDNIYLYQVKQGEDVLKNGKARLETVAEITVFDYTLDFTLS